MLLAGDTGDRGASMQRGGTAERPMDRETEGQSDRETDCRVYAAVVCDSGARTEVLGGLELHPCAERGCDPLGHQVSVIAVSSGKALQV